MKHALILALLGCAGLTISPAFADHDHSAHAAAAKGQPENLSAAGKKCCKPGKTGGAGHERCAHSGGHEHGAGGPRCEMSDARLAAIEKRLDAIQASLEQLLQNQAVKKP